MSPVNTERLRQIAEIEFADIVVEAFSPDVNELRIFLVDGSFVDVWFSLKLEERYSYHWERHAVDVPYTGTTTLLTGAGRGWRLFLVTFTTVARRT